MGTNMSTLPGAAGVICPKQTGAMERKAPCTGCKHWPKCMAVLNGMLG